MVAIFSSGGRCGPITPVPAPTVESADTVSKSDPAGGRPCKMKAAQRLSAASTQVTKSATANRILPGSTISRFTSR